MLISEIFERFLRSYFSKFKYRSIDTDDFKNFFEEHFQGTPKIKEIDWQKWLYGPGMPPVIPMYDKTLANHAEMILNKFLEWNGRDKFPITDQQKSKLTPSQVIYILQMLTDSERPPQSIEKLKALNKVFHFDTVKNSEIKFRWLRICIKAGWEEKAPDAFTWVNSVGRMKFVRPLYRDLYEWESTKQQAVDNFMANKHTMMYVTQYTLAKDLNIDL